MNLVLFLQCFRFSESCNLLYLSGILFCLCQIELGDHNKSAIHQKIKFYFFFNSVDFTLYKQNKLSQKTNFSI